ncbi:hypothetical protein [Bacillus thuringiensis]|uniref:hypothetical protein n=1 Tax=Bacillus thuringiensis TaxID=1428 RepID=UPI000BFBABC4|nr:hypothetical protein [Bacillus thuringiensis]PGM50862.1 hypothetical protein CN949_16355 [Bacillus thuringiensis]
MFTSNGHAPRKEGATSSRLDMFQERYQTEVDKIALDLIRGRYVIESTEVSVGFPYTAYGGKEVKFTAYTEHGANIELKFNVKR